MSYIREWYPDDYDWTNTQLDTHFTGAIGSHEWTWSGNPPKDPLELWDGVTDVWATTQQGINTIIYELNKPVRFAGMKIGVRMSNQVVGIEFLAVGHLNADDKILLGREVIMYENENWIPLTLEWDNTSIIEALEIQIYVHSESGTAVAGMGARVEGSGPSALAVWKEAPIPVEPAKILLKGPVMNSRLCFTDR